MRDEQVGVLRLPVAAAEHEVRRAGEALASLEVVLVAVLISLQDRVTRLARKTVFSVDLELGPIGRQVVETGFDVRDPLALAGLAERRLLIGGERNEGWKSQGISFLLCVLPGPPKADEPGKRFRIRE